MMLEAGPLTLNMLAHTTGCSEECVEDMQRIPATHVPADLNRKVRGLFERGITEYIRFHRSAPMKDKSPIVDFGSYMDGYEE